MDLYKTIMAKRNIINKSKKRQKKHFLELGQKNFTNNIFCTIIDIEYTVYIKLQKGCDLK